MIKKVNTYKFGPFVFSLKYNKHEINVSLAEAKILFRTIYDIPILPELASQLETELIKKCIFGTAAIEGNPLSEQEVGNIISQPRLERLENRAEKQIANLKKAYSEIIDKVKYTSDYLLDEKFIKSIHKMITDNSEGPDNIPGRYRNHLVKVGNKEHGGIYIPPKALDDIRNLMGHFVDWINSDLVLKEDPAIRAALAHYYLGLIHPFGDGNGRTARAIEAILLKSQGIKFVPHMLSNFYYKNIDDYFLAFSQAECNKDHDITPFLELFLKGLIESLSELQGTIFTLIRLFTLREYYMVLRRAKTITQRQHDLLTILLELHEEFSLRDLFIRDKFKIIYRNVSERTARRDIKKLIEKNLLIAEDKNKFLLNYKTME